MRQHRAFAPLTDIEVRDSGAPDAKYYFTGHASVFDLPCDFGYFTEYIAPGAFANALAKMPLEVTSNWQHDDRWLLGHTLNKTLSLSEDDTGLVQWTRPPAVSYADDLRVLLEEEYIQQASFCFTIAAETWEYTNEGEDDEEIRVTITEIGTLYDVTVCALGAYPQTDVSLASRSRLDTALRQGRVPGLALEDAHERGILDEDPELATRDARRGEDSVRAAERASAVAAREDSLARARRARAAMPRT